MIDLTYSNGKALLWNAKAIDDLREEHRIVGALIGSKPNKPFQMQDKYLPLLLMPEETKLLIEKGVARLVKCPEAPDEETLKFIYEERERFRQEQIAVMMENRKRTILEKADLIFEGKRRKLLGLGGGKRKCKKSAKRAKSKEMKASEIQESASMSEATGDTSSIPKGTGESSSISEATGESSINMEKDINTIVIDKEAIIQQELERWSDVTKYKPRGRKIFTECPWKKRMKLEEVSWEYPSTEEEKLRFAVFKDLWEKGLYITSGCKFGGDFLAYEGDPSKHHALYIVKCILPTCKFQAIDIVTHSRLGNQVKKTFALASVNSSGHVEYISFKWAPEMK